MEYESDYDILKELDEAPKGIQKKTSARSYIEEQVQPFLKQFNWTNETLEHDMKAFWIAVHRLNKCKPTYFKETLIWASEHRLHPMAFVKTVWKITRKK